jgi:hypothetical protein
MGISDRLKDLRTKAAEVAVERSDQIHDAVEKVATTADQHTGGKYSGRIQQMGAKADSLVEGLKGAGEQPGNSSSTQPQAEEPQAEDPPSTQPQAEDPPSTQAQA